MHQQSQPQKVDQNNKLLVAPLGNIEHKQTFIVYMEDVKAQGGDEFACGLTGC